jgi:hypothetical protein
MNEASEKYYPQADVGRGLAPIGRRNPDITIRQNIDEQIVMAEKRLSELQAIRDRLNASGLMDTRIADLQQAMQW